MYDDGSIVSKSDFKNRFNYNTNIWCLKYNYSIISAISKYVKDMNFSKDNYNMSYGATVGASAANSNLIEFKK